MTPPEQLPPDVDAAELEAYRVEMANCWIVAGLLAALPLERLDLWTAKAETLGPLLHPTIWREKAQSIMEDREMIRALATARRDVLTTAPTLEALGDLIAMQVEAMQPVLDQTFREAFAAPGIGRIPPAVIIAGLIAFISKRAPAVARANR